MASFSNTNGGSIFIGVDDSGKLVGVETPDQIQQRLVSAAQNICQPPVHPEMGSLEIGHDKYIVWARVRERTSGLCFVEGRCYIRVGPTSVPVTTFDQLETFRNKRSETSAKQSGRPPVRESRPPFLRAFCGRNTEIAKLKGTLSDPRISIIGIEGISGIGKTTLAAKLSEVARELELIPVWIECRSNSTLDTIRLELTAHCGALGWNTSVAALLNVEGSIRDQAIQIVRAIAPHSLLIVLNELHLVPNDGLNEFIWAAEEINSNIKLLLTSRKRPKGLGTHNALAVFELALQDGLDEASSKEYLEECGFSLDAKTARQIWHLTGKGHPKALQIFAARARTVPVATLLTTLPVFKIDFKEQWLFPLLDELDTECRAFVLDLAVFDHPMAISEIGRAFPTRDVISLTLNLIDRFVLEFSSTGEIIMHTLLRDSAYSLIPEVEKKHLWAAHFLLKDFTFQRDIPQLSNTDILRLLNSWSHAIKADPTNDLATKIAWSLRNALANSGSYAQLMLLLEKTSPSSDEYKHLFLLQKARILNIWGQHKEALEILDRLSMNLTPSIEREMVLVKASILMDFEKPDDAIALLKSQRKLLQNLKSSPHSTRYLSRLIEAHLLKGDYETAYD